jgi:hypothetical protein
MHRMVSLQAKHAMRYALRFPWWDRLHMLLAPRCCRDRAIRRMIGDALKCVRDAGQLEGDLVSSARPLQNHNAFSAEIKSGPEQQPNHKGYRGHKHVVTCDGDASARESNHVVREQNFLLCCAYGFLSAVICKPSWQRISFPIARMQFPAALTIYRRCDKRFASPQTTFTGEAG